MRKIKRIRLLWMPFWKFGTIEVCLKYQLCFRQLLSVALLQNGLLEVCIQRRKSLLRSCRLQRDWQVEKLLRTQSRRRQGRCLLKSSVSANEEENVQCAGKSSSPPSSNTSGSGLVELVTDGKEIKIEEEIVEAQPSCSSSSSGIPSNPSIPLGQRNQNSQKTFEVSDWI